MRDIHMTDNTAHALRKLDTQPLQPQIYVLLLVLYIEPSKIILQNIAKTNIISVCIPVIRTSYL